MPDYKLFCFDGAGKVWIEDWIVANTDEQAIAIARAVKDADTCELWHRHRLVARIDGGRTIMGHPPETPPRECWAIPKPVPRVGPKGTLPNKQRKARSTRGWAGQFSPAAGSDRPIESPHRFPGETRKRYTQSKVVSFWASTQLKVDGIDGWE